ncbi:MAG: hypothetical protein D6824_08385, partial [Planctomycetota bacterium]
MTPAAPEHRPTACCPRATGRAFVLAGVLWIAAGAAAQAPATAPATLPAAAEPITAQQVRQRIEALTASPLPDPELHKSVMESYTRALTLLSEAEQSRARAQTYRELAASGPDELERLRSELARPAEPPKVLIEPDENAERLAQRLANLQAELKAEQERLQQFEEQLRSRPERRKKLTDELAEARRRLAEVGDALVAAPKADEPPELTAARRIMLKSQQAALRAQIDALEQESLTYDIRGDLLTARRDLTARKVAALEAQIRTLEDAVRERRQLEARRQAEEAERMRREAARSHPVVREVAEENARLARLRAEVGLADKIADVGRRLEERRAELAALEAGFQRIKTQVETVGLTPAVGQRLRVLRTQLEDARDLARRSARLQEQLAEATSQVLVLSDQLSELAALETVVTEKLRGVDASIDPAQREEIRAALIELLNQRRQILSSLKSDYESYSVRLTELDATLRQLIRQTREFREYVDQRILWVRSASPPGRSSLARAVSVLTERLGAPQAWQRVGADVWEGGVRHTAVSVTVLILIASLLLGRPRFGRRLGHLAEVAERGTTQSFLPTAESLLLTALCILPWPGLLWTLAALLTSAAQPHELSLALARGLSATGWLAALSLAVAQVCRSDGLAVAHFGWPPPAATFLRRVARWAALSGGPVLLVWATLDGLPEAWGLVPLAQIGFALFQVALLIAAVRLLTGHRSVVRWFAGDMQSKRAVLLRLVIRPVCLAVPMVLGGLSLSGYHYTATRLFHGVALTAGLGLGVLLGYLLALRWLLVGQRRLALERARRKREAAQKATEGAPAEVSAAAAAADVDISSISAQARSITASVAVLVLILGLWYTWNETLPGLAFLKHVTLWTTTQQVTETVVGADGTPATRTVQRLTSITLANLTLALVVVLLTVILARNLPGLLEITVLRNLPLGAGERYAASAVTRYFIVTVGIIVAFGVIGVGWSKVQWL